VPAVLTTATVKFKDLSIVKSRFFQVCLKILFLLQYRFV